jgi:recombination protein RecA
MDKQKYLSQEFFPTIKPLIEESNVLLVIISQVREKIGITFGSKFTRSGGKALEFYCHHIAWLAVAEKLTVTIKGMEKTLGIRGKLKTTKSRTPRPFRESYYTILFDYGIDDLSSNIDFLFGLLTELGKDKTGKKDFKVEYKDIVHNSKKDLVEYIEKNNLEAEIKQDVIEVWESIEQSIKSNRKSKKDM